MEKLKKTAVVIDTLLKVGFILVIVCMALILVSNALMLVVGPANIENGTLTYKVGGVNLVLADGFDELEAVQFNGYQFAKQFLMMSASALVAMAVVLVGIKMLREIIAPMKEGGPFVAGISLKMRNFGIFVLIAGVVENIVQLITSFIVKEIFETVVVQDTYISDITYENVIGGNFILFALFIFLLSYIFKYGEELQRQSDETL